MEFRSRHDYLSAGWPAYPRAEMNWFSVDQLATADFGNGPAALAGRIAAINSAKLTLSWGGVDLEVEVTWPQTDPFSQNKLHAAVFREGDIILLHAERIHGVISCLSVGLLSPCLSDSFQRQAHAEFSVAESRRWNQYLLAVRELFAKQSFIELNTPTLVPCPGTEPFLDPFSTEYRFGSRVQKFFLPTSPEYHLKRALSDGWSQIFEIRPCFRNAEQSDHHQPEFMMLEWYRCFQPIEKLIDDINLLLRHVGPIFGREISDVRVTSFPELLAEVLPGAMLHAQITRDELSSLAQKMGVHVAGDDDWNDIFYRIVLEKIESRLTGPVIISGYPRSQSALARTRADGWSDRFEFYWDGLEIANAFCELNDPAENQARQLQDIADRRKRPGASDLTLDDGLDRALRNGLPPACGIALGLERLYMALSGKKDILSTRAYTHIRPEQ